MRKYNICVVFFSLCTCYNAAGWNDIYFAFGEGIMLSEMKSYCHVKPGQKGSKRLVEQYGDRLLCVRYRYDSLRGVRLKTIEIIVEERPWQPPFRFRDEDVAPVTVAFGETALREKLRKLRAIWDPEAKVWMVRYGKIRGTELEARIPAEFLKGARKR
jgi:hypothetical protein